MIGSVLQPEFEEMIREKRWAELREVLSELDSSDIAELLVDLPAEDDAALFRLLPRDRAGEVFGHLPLTNQEDLLRAFSNDQVRTVFGEMTPDDRTRLLEELPAEVTRRLLETLSPAELATARDLLGYPPETAGRYMTPRYVTLRPDMNARDAIAHIRRTGRGKETLDVLYIVDPTGQLLDNVSLGSLILAKEETLVTEVDDLPLVSVEAVADREEMARAFEKYDRSVLPVTDSHGQMLGIVTVDDVLDVLESEATEDIQKLGGSEALDAPYKEVGIWPMLHKRGGWLAILFIGETLTATAMGKFEHWIAAVPMLALFVPLIISSGGNSGSQATSIIIRSLALRELRLRDWFYVFAKELRTSAILGAFLGAIGCGRILLWYWAGWHDYAGHPYMMGLTVWLSLIGVVTFGSIIGSMLPFILRRIGFDPATASAPFVATLVDVTGLIIYFLVAYLILSGTVL